MGVLLLSHPRAEHRNPPLKHLGNFGEGGEPIVPVVVGKGGDNEYDYKKSTDHI